ncbi:ABC transporter permease [Candidatus Omnitrophota bacterium]
MNFSLRRFKAIAEKEYLELKRNKLFFLMMMLAPTILFFLFAYGFPLSAKNITMGVVDFDKTPLSRSLIDSFESATNLFQVKKVVNNYPEVERELALGKLRTILVIPAHFSEKVRKARPVSLQVIIDGIYPNNANLVGGYIDAVIVAFQSGILEKYMLTHYGSSGSSAMPIDLTVSTWYNSSFRSEDFIVPGIIAIVMMFFPPLVSTISLAKEKETGSILNMYCSSMTKTEYLLGKMLPYIIISYINFLLFLALTVFMFHVPMRGSLTVLLIVSFFYVATCIAVGLLVAVIVSTQVAAILITCIGTLTPAFLYSGFMVPISNIGRDAKTMAYMLPCTYYIDLTRKVMVKGAGFMHLRMDAMMLVVFCVGLYFICIKLFKKRLG